jgi:guanine deaminase
MDEKFMREAIALSIENVRTGRGGPFGAVVVRDGSIIARGVNRVTATNDPTAHAEMLAIRAACLALGSFHLGGCVVYTSSEPCPMCLGALYWARVARYYYGNTSLEAAGIGFNDLTIYEEINKSHQQRAVPGFRLLPEEAAEAFVEWMRSPLKLTY